MTTCPECGIDEPLDGLVLHAGKVLCVSCSARCKCGDEIRLDEVRA